MSMAHNMATFRIETNQLNDTNECELIVYLHAERWKNTNISSQHQEIIIETFEEIEDIDLFLSQQ